MQRIRQLTQRAGRGVTRWLSPAVFAMLFAAIVVGGLLFIPPIHGLADNGSFAQTLANNGLYQLDGYQVVGYLNPQLGLMRYYDEVRSAGLGGFSSQRLFVGLAIGLNKLIFSSTRFDLRCLGLVYYLPFVGAVGLLTRALTQPYRRIRSYVLAAVIVVIFADTSLTLAFNSFYVAPILLITAMMMVGSLLLLSRTTTHRGRLMSLYFLSATLLITSQPQNAPLTVSYLIMALGGFFVFQHPAQRLGLVLGMTVLVDCGVTMGLALTPQQRSVNRYQAFTHGVLHETKDPSRALTQQGVSQQFALMRENDYYPVNFTELSPDTHYVRQHLTRYVGVGWVLTYYGHHWPQLRQLLDLAAANLMATQVKSVGNYPAHSGHAKGAQVKFFTLASTTAGTFFPRRFAFDALLVVALLLVFGVGAYNDLHQRRTYGVVRFFLVTGLLLNLLLVPLLVILTTGVTNLAQNLLLAAISLNLVLVILVADLLNHRLWHADDRQVIDDD
ncbi:glycan biosynthesis hexose transferase WsfD [Levilactobacillus acidifarinae]|uniref:Putative membrane protein n=1 Tax=Levilactobacillus acidifarinae DSM 19394 = JCM 15949 TaxID=1423715 RepID=A0A0R1LS82_9LACO|nr:hypothetical protein [Levilactobacillus acidifarinae]KRK96451.1 putative membrane protein [Levilactobacillus acidifarinae DSM 19394]GEO68963.1 hypothetical protein LAC03_08730 [Levilactobacillus acidifarinae]